MRIISELNAPILSIDLNDKSTSVDGQRLKAGTHEPSTSPQSKLAWIVSMFDVNGENIDVHQWADSEATKMFVPSGNSYTINTNMMMFIDGAIVIIEKEDVKTFSTASGNCVYVVYDHANKTCNFPTYSVEQKFSVEEWKKTIYLGKFNGSNIVLNDDAYKKPPAEDSEAVGGVSLCDLVLKTDLVITDENGDYQNPGEWFKTHLGQAILWYLKDLGIVADVTEDGRTNTYFRAHQVWAKDDWRDGDYFLNFYHLDNTPVVYQPAAHRDMELEDSRAIFIEKSPPTNNLRDGDIWLQYYD